MTEERLSADALCAGCRSIPDSWSFMGPADESPVLARLHVAGNPLAEQRATCGACGTVYTYWYGRHDDGEDMHLLERLPPRDEPRPSGPPVTGPL